MARVCVALLSLAGLCGAGDSPKALGSPASSFAKAGDFRGACASLTGLSGDDVVVDGTELVESGAGVTSAPKDLPSFCRVRATIRPARASNVRVEIWLPAAWNGKFLGSGNGGVGGQMDYPALADGLRRGFAVANTDLGTSSGMGAMVGQMDAIVDFGHRATHRMTLLGKAAVERFYGRKPQYSYFRGCSTGGGQGMHEVQRYPLDYDGVLAGAPGAGRVPAHLAFQWVFDVLHRDVASYIPPAKRDIWAKRVMSACDGLDGVRDGLISRPQQCAIDPSVLQCTGGGDGPDCFSPAQVTALRKIYEGPRDPVSKAQLAPGYLRGTEALLLFGDAPPAAEPPMPFPFIWVWGEKWDWRNFNWSGDVDAMHNTLDWAVDATSVDLAAFTGHGGKLIVYQGLADPIQVPGAAIDYMARLDRATSGRAADSSALFLAPGMSHCAGGYGPNVLGDVQAGFVPELSQDPRRDAFAALQQWVESGRRPEWIVATQFENGAGSRQLRTGLLCAWPKVAVLKAGARAVADAKSFECRMPD